ncbi:polymorphic toxin-type HINT domain-containing protein [Streptomyces hydrogenans]
MFGIGITRKRTGGERRGRSRFIVHSLALALVVPVGLVPVAQAADSKGGLGRPKLPAQRVSKVKAVDELGAQKARAKVAQDRTVNAEQARRALAEQKSTWPERGTATITFTDGKAGKDTPGGIPVTLEPKPAKRNERTPSSARITILDQKAADKAGITGVLLTADADTAGPTGITIDYSSFASKVGGGWAQRLQLVQLPACVLTTPEKADCHKQTPLKSSNNMHEQSVSAQVTLPESIDGVSAQLASGSAGAMVLAVTAAAAGTGPSPAGTGDYSATELSESSSWAAGGSSGSFTWSYGFNLPPAAAGPTPVLSLGYDSGSIDGRTATTNNQGTSVGEGFSLTESYIERSYGSCDDDGQTDVFDLCWKYDNAQLVLNGKSSRLVKDTATGAWRLADDDASTVTRSIGADNKDDDGEYWTVTTGDGTKYVFGLDKLDGATTERTNSTWTVPVFGDDTGEPGYTGGSTFADRALTQAWRWNLDYVEDVHGNASTYWYAKDENYYKKNKATTANASYDRGGYPREIKYGLRKGALFTDDADAKVTFVYAERCDDGLDCSSLTKETSDNWPDVPFDAICSSGDDECLASSPAFFSRKRLTGVNTYSWNATTSTHDPVDSWVLTQKYLDGGDIGDTSDHVLTLQSITRTGKAGATSIGLDPITFTYQTRPNRVDGTDDILPLTRHRISTITSETGAITTVTLSSPECVRSQVMGAAEDTNTRSCYPQYWNINGAENASVDWFHKYRVLAVTVSDPAGQNEAVEHAYEYAGAAWHYSDSPFTPRDERTWSDWRGYRQVTVYTGALQTTRSKTVSLYMQGMDGDRKKDGTTKAVTITPLAQPSVGVATLTDSDPYAGQLREKVVYNGTQPISVTAHQPWSKETARQSGVPDAGDHVARYVRTKQTTTYTYLTISNSWRHRVVKTTFDDVYGMPVTEEDSGLYSAAGDEVCKVTWYARDAAAGLTAFASRTRAVGRACSVADTSLDLPADSTRRGDVLSDTAIAYDGATTWSATMKPTKGLATWTGRAQGYGAAGAVSWQKTATTAYDTLGRPLSVTNADGKTTSTAYTPESAGPLTKTIVTDPKGYKAVSFLDPRRGQRERIYDANQKKTELVYDALGRLTDAWLPNRNRAAGYSPNSKFAYSLSKTKQSWVSTATLKKDGTTYNTTYAIVDALLRPLQTQSPTPHGGRLLTDTRYDTRGLAYETYADIFDNTAAPNGSYTRAEYGEAPSQGHTIFDGAGRATTSTLYVFGAEKWSTSTSYTGDSTATTALQGGSAARIITDIRGQTIETREYAGPDPADTDFGGGIGGSFSSTKFTYALDGRQTSVTGPDEESWSYGFDLFGRPTSSQDPDTGKTTTAYNALDQAIKSTDSRGQSVLTEYDDLGRTTGTWSGTKTDANQLTSYTYDTLLKGLPTSATRYVGGKAGQAYATTVTAYDTLDRPVGSTLQLPANDPFVQAGAPATLQYASYYSVDGTLQNNEEPALGGLQPEVISYGYDTLGNLTSIGGSTGYLLDVDYSALSQPQQLVMGTANTEAHKKNFVTNTFEEGTGRLTRSHVTDQTHPYMLQDLNYTFDQAGNITAIADPTNLGGTTAAETQCFAYDGHRRLTEAWTPTSQKCSDPRSATSLSGPAPYWTSYTYNQAGQRATETLHKSTGDTKTTYCYTGTQPHTLTGTSTGATANCTTPTRAYTYDPTGNTTKRPGKTGTQDLTWSAEGKLTKLTESGKSTDYLYGADGNLLIRTTQGGERILYTGATELHLRANGTTWAQRYYSSGGTAVAVRSNETGTQKLTYLAGDHHGTQSLAISADATQTFSKRRMTPFGADRGTPTGTAWPDDKGFLGKTDDKTTGLTHIGAREYDPAIGQFISVDPLLELDKPQTLNGYSYAANSPITLSDPTGMCIDAGNGRCETDSAFTPGSNIKADGGSEGGNTDDGTAGQSASSTAASTTASNSTGTTSSTGQPVIHGITLPTEEEMRAMPLAWPGDTYEELAHKWAMQKCYGLGGPGEGAEAFCGVAEEAGLLDTAPDPWGVQYNVNCITGKGDCTEALISNIITLATWAFGRLIGPPAAGATAGEGALTRLLRGCAKCFLAGTEVLMDDGTTKAIEDIKIGDKVLATDPETGETGPREVTRLIQTENDKHFNTLSITTQEGIEELTATHEHPFWSPSEHAWIEASQLQPGMTLLTDNGNTAIITGNKPFTKHARTYNLTVDDLHTYYVLAGETPVLVHNSGVGSDPTSFSNLIPEDTPEWFKPIAPGTTLNRSGNYAYVVTGDGELVIGKRTAGHVSIAKGKDVLAAGEFKTKGGEVVYLDNKSGHYRPYGENAQKAAVDAFNKNGLGADGKYIEAWGPSC